MGVAIGFCFNLENFTIGLYQLTIQEKREELSV
jgi:hypothetical protein